MSFPFRFKTRPDTFADLVEYLRTVVERFPGAEPAARSTSAELDAVELAYRDYYGDSAEEKR